MDRIYVERSKLFHSTIPQKDQMKYASLFYWEHGSALKIRQRSLILAAFTTSASHQTPPAAFPASPFVPGGHPTASALTHQRWSATAWVSCIDEDRSRQDDFTPRACLTAAASKTDRVSAKPYWYDISPWCLDRRQQDTRSC